MSSSHLRNVVLIVQYYAVCNGDRKYNKLRQQEIDLCLRKNLCQDYIDEIYVLTEQRFSFERFFSEETEHARIKLKQVVIGKRMTYADAFSFYNRTLLGKIAVLANADIYFTSSLHLLHSMDLSKSFLALTRYESIMEKKQIYGKDCDLSLLNPWLHSYETAVFSQDTWIWCSDIFLRIYNCDFALGLTGCDNLISRRILEAGFSVLNLCHFIATIHVDSQSLMYIDGKKEHVSRSRISQQRGHRVGSLSEYVFLHPTMYFPTIEYQIRDQTRFHTETTGASSSSSSSPPLLPSFLSAASNRSPQNSLLRSQIFSTEFAFPTSQALRLNDCNITSIHTSVPTYLVSSTAELLSLKEDEYFHIKEKCCECQMIIDLDREKEIVSVFFLAGENIEQLCIDLITSRDGEITHAFDVFVNQCYRECDKLVFHVNCFRKRCRSIRLRWYGHFEANSSIKWFMHMGSDTCMETTGKISVEDLDIERPADLNDDGNDVTTSVTNCIIDIDPPDENDVCIQEDTKNEEDVHRIQSDVRRHPFFPSKRKDDSFLHIVSSQLHTRGVVSVPTLFPMSMEDFEDECTAFVLQENVHEFEITFYFGFSVFIDFLMHDFPVNGERVKVYMSKTQLTRYETCWKPSFEFTDFSKELVLNESCSALKCVVTCSSEAAPGGGEETKRKAKLVPRTNANMSLHSYLQSSTDAILNLSLWLNHKSLLDVLDEEDASYKFSKLERLSKTSISSPQWLAVDENRRFYRDLESVSKFLTNYCRVQKRETKKEGISIVISIMNRAENIQKCAQSWFRQNVDEIVIVDWSSTCSSSLQQMLEESFQIYFKDDSSRNTDGYGDKDADKEKKRSLPKVKLVRVEGETDFYRTAAQNLGVSCASYDKILKLDSDVSLSEDFFETHVLEEGCFFVGDWRLARDENERYLHGNAFFFYSDFEVINGYDERIRTYGWDDSDFTERLLLLGLRRQHFHLDYMYHHPHTHEERCVNLRGVAKIKNPEVMTLKHRLLLRQMSLWSRAHDRQRFISSAAEKETFKFHQGVQFDVRIYERDASSCDFEFPSDMETECEEKAQLIVDSWV